MSQEIPEHVMDAILQQLLSGNKLEAVKLYKDQTQSSLAEAKAAIEGLSATIAQPAVQVFNDSSMESELEQLIYSRQKLAAVKLYRERHSVSLLDAKHAVEKLTEELQTQSPERFIANSSTGCASILIAIAVVQAEIVWYVCFVC